MKFKFDAHQEYQLQAIQAVVNLFAGQPRVEVDLSALVSGPVPAIANRLDLDETALVDNLRSVQAEGGLPPDTALQYIEETTDLVAGSSRVRFANFSVEMETGTGKTYVELRTILELHRSYGMRKFIIVVPSIAIREGILKSLQITAEHFRELYTNLPYRYYVYDSGNLSQVRQFALSNGVEIMIMTLASFNKDMNVIKQSTDRLAGATPIHLVQAARPILILDEPQNMESRKSAQALAALNPLFALRYSATHRNPYNLVHRLTPYEAYRQGLVKRIEVAGMEEVDNANLPFIELRKIVTEKNRVRASLVVHRRMANGTIREAVVTVKPGENLEGKTNRSDYAVFIVEEINPGWDEIRFSNGVTLKVGESTGHDKKAIWEAQILYTLEEHFIKQKRLHALGIKVLSLFFIDRVDNYVNPDSTLRLLFNRCFRQVAAQYPQLCLAIWAQEVVDPEVVQGSYFANRRTKAGEVVYEESITGESQLDRQAYDLIMKDKERLLSFSEPVAFIFSHSALREGWDNPNVFQICTLNQTASEVKKRQEIGRGVRLAVDQSGDRNHEERVNVLTVVANQSYQEYVSRLQTELDEEYTPTEQAPRPTNARQRGQSRLKKAYYLSSEFFGLWEAIKHKTRYLVQIDSQKLISDVVAELDKTIILPPRIEMTKVLLETREEYGFTPMQVSGAKTMIDLAGRYPLPNLVALMEELLERTAPSLRLSRKTLLEIYKRTSNQQSALNNPQEFANVTVGIIRRHLMDQLVAGIRYEKIGAWYEMTRFADPDFLESWQEYLVPAEHSLYDPVILDSDAEREFLQTLERRRDVKLYVKLPKWFTVDTPVGGYNPDWAIVIEPIDVHGQPTGEQQVYLVHETKDTTDPDKLRPDEWRRIQCGEKHFKDTLGVEFDWGPELKE
ncbi:MAG: DEAD/DEAH box helicase family protein [Anaerolineales bacterium]|nr:DEAD/DEAH box helicase family protein [Anaerolineales bacterium]